MGLQGYVGSAEDQRRIRRQEKEREEKKKQFEEAKQQSDANVDGSGLRQFGAGTSETLEAAFKIETVGLVTREEFLSKRETLKDRMDEAKAQAKREADKALNQEKLERSKKKAKIAAKTKLSFGGDDDEDGDGDAEEATEAAGMADKEAPSKGHEADKTANGSQQAAPRKLGKDPTAQTDFLPDHEREAQEVAVREQLRKEYELRQKLMKNEPLKITYSYWDGQGHRRILTIRKGDTIAQFLQKVKEQLHADFRELRQDFGNFELLESQKPAPEPRAASVSSLMYVKEDLIIPHNISFYDLISSKARGKSGPLFHFDVHEDIRLQNDARIEKDESHAGKVVDRHWYNRNKHIFPASRWEVFDPDTNYETYTIHGYEVM